MNSTFSQLTVSLACLALAFAAAPAPAPHAAGWVADQDGVTLYLRLPATASSANPEVACEVVNSTDSPVAVDFHRYTSLGFRLFDSAGKEIRHDPKWWRMNDPNASDVGRHMVQQLMPGKGFVYLLKLDEAFGTAWSKGTTLQVEHFPGTDGKGGLIMQGRGLSGRIDITPLTRAGQGKPNNGTEKDAGVKDDGHPEGTAKPAGDAGGHEPGTVKCSPSAIPKGAQQDKTPDLAPGNTWLWVLGLGLIVLAMVLALARWARKRAP